MADLGWTKYISDVEKAASQGLFVHEICWEEVLGEGEQDEIVNAIEIAISELPYSIQEKIEKIIIARGPNPNE